MPINVKWYQANLAPLLWPLIPFSFLFYVIVNIRRYFYRLGWLRATRLPVPVIVVGNISIGGTGKTPFVLWLAAWLKAQGFKPGIVSRGVGAGNDRATTQCVTKDADPQAVGDEALLLQASGCPVVVGIKRVLAAQQLLRDFSCDIILTDDGLQHYALAREIEIGLIDGERQLGNGWLLPAGPLREPKQRLQELAFVISKEKQLTAKAQATMCLEAVEWVSVQDEALTKPINAFAGQGAQVVAGIGNPQQFFQQVSSLGVNVIAQTVFPDHHLYRANDFAACSSAPIIMTAKDAVKCHAFADERFWYLRVKARLSADVEQQLMHLLEQKGIKPDAKLTAIDPISVDDEFKPTRACDRARL